MTSTTSSLTAVRPSEKTKLSGHIIAMPAAIVAIACFFLPWIAYVAENTFLLSMTGLEIATGSTIVTGGGATLFRGSSMAYLLPLAGILTLVMALLAWRRGYPSRWDGFGMIGLGLVTAVIIWIKVTSMVKLAETAGVTLQYQYGLILSFLALLAFIVAGVLHVRTAAKRDPSLQGTIGAWGFMSPAMLLVVVFFIIPVALLMVLSLTNLSSSNFSEPWTFVGLENYRRMFSDTFFPKILRNTLLYVVLTLAFFNVGMALVIALLTSQINRRAGFFFRMLWLLPRITPSVVYIVMWKRFTQVPPYGIINQFLGIVGIENQPYWLTTAPFMFVILVNGFVGASFGMILFSSAIEAIPKDLTTAARVDGASPWQIIRDITLPMLKWPLLFVVSYQTLSLLVSFEYILLLTNGGPGLYTTEVWALTSYKRALGTYFGSNQWGYGASWGFVLVFIGVILSFIYLRVFRFNDLVQEPKIDVL